jgi:hypothetical protein
MARSSGEVLRVTGAWNATGSHMGIMKSKIGAIIFLLACVLLLFVLLNMAHFRFFPVRVLLYDSLLDVGVVGVTMLCAYNLVFRSRMPLTPHEAVLTITLGLALAVNYAIVVPTVIDRSLSIYILEKLAQQGGSVRYDAFEDILRNQYMSEYRVADIRLTEQLNSGTVTISDGCVRLTSRGERIARFTHFFRTSVLPKQREIMGSYSDALTDPFRDSKDLPQSKCPEK